jgi:hypothetical protein
MAEYLSGSMPRDAISPEGLNAVTASTFAGHIGLKFSEVGSERVCGSLTVSAELLQAANGVVHVTVLPGSAGGDGVTHLLQYAVL